MCLHLRIAYIGALVSGNGIGEWYRGMVSGNGLGGMVLGEWYLWEFFTHSIPYPLGFSPIFAPIQYILSYTPI
jgi:hypothetical protein